MFGKTALVYGAGTQVCDLQVSQIKFYFLKLVISLGIDQ